MDSEASSVLNSGVQVVGAAVAVASGQSKVTDDSIAAGVLHRKPFKLRFGTEIDLGRSTVSSTKPLGLLPRLTSKFYTKGATEMDKSQAKQDQVNEIKNKIDNLFNQGPREKLAFPRLESQRYGWYQDLQSTESKRRDKRFCFGINSSPMVKYRILILANDAASNPISLVNMKAKS